jgi:exonuclease SbcC
MIITALRAYNVLKYAQLQLDNLPEKGIIAISGHNESGKSSIGEILCFALYGRTFSLKPTHMKKIIRWGEDNCSVSLNFRVEDKEYNLFRFLDESGTHAAKLSLVGYEDTPLARSPEHVDEVVTGILGYNFEEFIESFYLAQREITSPHPHGKAVKSIAGVDALEQVTSAYEQDVNAHKEKLRILSVEKAGLQDELDELALEEGHLEALKDERHKLNTDLEVARSLTTYLKNAADTYITNEGRIKQAGKKRGRARFWRLQCLLFALVAGGVWGLLTLNSELPLSLQLLENLQTTVPGWQQAYINYIGIAGAVFAVLFLLFWQRSSSHNNRIGVMKAESARLAGIMDQVRSVTVYELVSETTSEDDEDLQAGVSHSDAAERYSVDKYEDLLSQVQSVTAVASDVADYVEIEQRWLAEQISLRKLTIGHLADEINEETDRVNLAEQLHSEIASLQGSSDELSEQLDQWGKAIELLTGASKHFSSKFNRDIRDLMARNLPVFTQGRYEHLQIQPGLGVRLFSNDKHDFLDMDEISSGTQRQVMLALRLAMAQKLMGQTVKGRQFAFLDEPFAFFDEERTRHALQALDKLSDAISQIWIVSQTFPEGHEFAAEIKCSREQGKLSLAV